MIRVGIPRALLYYQYGVLWRTFFEELGAEVVFSPATSRAMLAFGSSRVVAETCLPVKVYIGHVQELADKCDYLFIPAIRSIEKNVYNCSKFLGLPDLIKAVVPGSPPILDVDIDVNKGKASLHPSTYGLGRRFTWNPRKVKEAGEKAWQAHIQYKERMRWEGLTPLDLSDEAGNADIKKGKTYSSQLTIAVIGHPYKIYDEYITHRLVHRLGALGVRVVTPEMTREEDLAGGVAKLVGKPYWTYEGEITGAGGHFLESAVDGVISVVAFGCGPDSTMIDVVQRFSKKKGTRPFMCLTIDEHTAEAGLVTRLEAFLDMVKRRKRLASCV